MSIILTILIAIVTAYLTVSVLYLFFFSVAGSIRPAPSHAKSSRHQRMVVLVPAYREDAVIADSVRSLMMQDYPKGLFEVVVIADELEPATIAQLKSFQAQVIEVSFSESTKAKAINAALAELPRLEFDVAIVMDADNHVDHDFLTRMNHAFGPSTMAVQAHRVAKNLNTPLAILDGVSEEINNHIFRLGHRAVGMSAALVGSGMAFRYRLFLRLMDQCHAVGGFDKELELELSKGGITVEYLHDVQVRDEKVDRPSRFVGQRRRWLAAQAHYASRGLAQLVGRPFRSWRLDHVDKVFQMVLPPRVLLVALLPLMTIAAAFWWPGLSIWLGFLTLLLLVGLALAIPKSLRRTHMREAVLFLPQAALLMLLAAVRSFGANRRFIHTGHDAPTAINNQTSS